MLLQYTQPCRQNQYLFQYLNHLIPYNPGLPIVSEKNNLGQTMGPTVLYTHAKNWEDTIGVKAYKHHTDGQKHNFLTLNPL